MAKSARVAKSTIALQSRVEEGSTGRLVLPLSGESVTVAVMRGAIVAAESPTDETDLVRRLARRGGLDADVAAQLAQAAETGSVFSHLLERAEPAALDAALYDQFTYNLTRFLTVDAKPDFTEERSIFADNLQFGFHGLDAVNALIAACIANHLAAASVGLDDLLVIAKPRLSGDTGLTLAALLARGPTRVHELLDALPGDPFAARATIGRHLDAGDVRIPGTAPIEDLRTVIDEVDDPIDNSIADEGIADEGIADEGIADEGIAAEGIAAEGIAAEGASPSDAPDPQSADTLRVELAGPAAGDAATGSDEDASDPPSALTELDLEFEIDLALVGADGTDSSEVCEPTDEVPELELELELDLDDSIDEDPIDESLNDAGGLSTDDINHADPAVDDFDEGDATQEVARPDDDDSNGSDINDGAGNLSSLNSWLSDASKVEDDELDFFSDHDYDRGSGEGGFSTSAADLDRISIGEEKAPSAADEPLEQHEVPSTKFGAPVLEEDEASAKIDVANDVLRRVSAAFDASEGAGRGRSVVQLLVDGSPRRFVPLWQDLNVTEIGELPVDATLDNLWNRPQTEHRQLLNDALKDLLERALSSAADDLPDDAFDQVYESVAGYGQRLGL